MQQNGKLRTTAKLEACPGASRKEFLLSALDQYERPLTAYATRMFCGNLENAQDAVQHTFMQLCKQPPGKVIHKLAPWLYTVCRNRVLDELKSNNRQSATDPQSFDSIDPNASDPADRAEQIDFLRHLRKLMTGLRESERDVIELWSHGFHAKEISQILGQPSGTVRVNLHRALKKLREHPEVGNWLERATGHVANPDGRSDVDPLMLDRASTFSENSAHSPTGERS